MARTKKEPVMSLAGPKHPTAEKALEIMRPATAISIKDAPKIAEQFVDAENHGLKDDAAIVCVGDRLLVRKLPPASKTYGGLVLPDLGKSEAAYGVVVAAGQGRYNIAGQLIPLRVMTGAVVCMGKYAGTACAVLGYGNQEGECVVVREEEIFYVVTSKAIAAEIAAKGNPRVEPLIPSGEDKSAAARSEEK